MYPLKVEQAKEYSAQHIGEVMAMLKTAYDDGLDNRMKE